MRIKPWLICLVFLAFALSGAAQELSPFGPDPQPDDPPARTNKRQNRPEKLIDKFFFGGNLGLQVGSVTYINVAPIVGYKVTDRYRVGVGLNYIYTNYFGQANHLIGGRIFQQFFVWKGIFLHAEHEFMSYPTGYTDGNGKKIKNIANSFNVGAGYQQNFGRRAFTNVMILYNVIHDRNNTIYNNPWSLRFTVGF